MRLFSLLLAVTYVNLAIAESLPFPIPIPKPVHPLKPGKPVLRADLREISQTMPPTGVMVLPYQQQTLTLFKDGEFPVSFELAETFGPPPCTSQICPMMMMPSRLQLTQFKIWMQRDAGCGSRKLYANEVVNRKNTGNKYKPATLVLLDHSARLCDDVVPAVWEVSLKRPRAGARKFLGDPKPVETATDCSSIDSNTACIMLYAPATCSVSSIDGKSVTPPVVASGGNSCLAISNLRKAVCERGLPYDRMDENNVICSVTSPVPCAMPMCAAPPEGCDYISDPTLDKNGCPANPCGRLVCKKPPVTTFDANAAELHSYCGMNCEAIVYIQAPVKESCSYMHFSNNVVTTVSPSFSGGDGCQARRSLCQYVEGREWVQEGVYGYQCEAAASPN